MPGDLTRRRLFRLACGCGCAGFIGASPALAAPKLMKGCLITDYGLKVYRSQGNPVRSLGKNVFDQGKAKRTTGRPDIDEQLYRAIKIAAGVLKVNPGFGFFEPDRFLGENELEAMNAFATNRTIMPGTRGTVAFGMGKFTSELYGYDDTGTTVMTIVAHEFGHIVQFDRGYHTAIDYGTPNNVEINADFLAGYYLGVRKLSVPSLQFERAREFLRRVGTNKPDRRHGTSEERAEAGQAGFRCGYIERKSLDDAVQAGLHYVGYFGS